MIFQNRNIVGKMLSCNRRWIKINAVDKDNNTPLLLAVRNSHTDIVTLLLNSGASTEAMDKDNNTPLLAAARSGHTDIVTLLHLF